MPKNSRQFILDKIKANIDRHGYHVRIVAGGPSPRVAYTIGLHEQWGYELVFGGGTIYRVDEINTIIGKMAEIILASGYNSLPVTVNHLGEFTTAIVDETWSSSILLGALDYYGVDKISALQIVPDAKHWTIDVPRMSEPWDSLNHPVWKWLGCEWDYQISRRSEGVTNVDALQGRAITEVMRWEENQWELFAGAGPDINKDDIRVVPIGTLLATDDSLGCITQLIVGTGLWREGRADHWHPWRPSQTG